MDIYYIIEMDNIDLSFVEVELLHDYIEELGDETSWIYKVLVASIDGDIITLIENNEYLNEPLTILIKLAQIHGHKTILNYLLDYYKTNYNKSIYYKSNINLLLWAIKFKIFSIIDFILDNKLLIYDDDNNDIYHTLFSYGNMEIIDKILNYTDPYGNKLTIRPNNHTTLLVASGGDPEVMNFILKYINPSSYTLDTAIHFGNLEIIKMLLNWTSPNNEKIVPSDNVLLYACKSNKVEVVDYILKWIKLYKYNVYQGIEVLNVAIDNKNIEIIKLLLNVEKISLNVISSKTLSSNILDKAISSNNYNIVKLFLTFVFPNGEKLKPTYDNINYSFRHGNSVIIELLLYYYDNDIYYDFFKNLQYLNNLFENNKIKTVLRYFIKYDHTLDEPEFTELSPNKFKIIQKLYNEILEESNILHEHTKLPSDLVEIIKNYFGTRRIKSSRKTRKTRNRRIKKSIRSKRI